MIMEKIMSEIKKVQCPHCKEMVTFEKNSAGQWVGTIVGGGTDIY